MKTSRKFWTALAAALVLCSGIAMAQGHDELPGGKKKKTMLELFETTGWVGYLMVVCSLAGTTLCIEHLVNLRREKIAPQQLADELQALIEEEKYDDAIELCDSAFESYVGVALDNSRYSYVYYTPTEESWAGGDRVVMCSVEDGRRLIEGSVEGAER